VRGTVDGGGFELRTRAPVERVAKVKDHYEVNGESFDLVVNTVPLPIIEPCIAGIPPEVRADIRALQPISLVCVLIGVRAEAPIPPYSWIYLPFPEQGLANRVTFFSNYSPQNAPPGHASFMAEVTHRGELAPDRPWARGLAEHLGRLGLYDPRAVTTIDWTDNRFAYIDQDMEFPARIARVRAWLDSSGYVSFGRFGRYEYHNSDQCIARAMEVHAHVREIAAAGTPARPVFRNSV
jgi:protoporphyrinogen oxidase